MKDREIIDLCRRIETSQRHRDAKIGHCEHLQVPTRAMFKKRATAPGILHLTEIKAELARTNESGWTNSENPMRSLVSAVFVAALALAGSSALAQDPVDHTKHHPPEAAAESASPPTVAGPAREGMAMEMTPMRHGCHMAAKHLAAVKAELGLTPAQLPLWTRFEAASQAAEPGEMDMSMMGADKTLPDRMAAHEKMLAAHLKSLRRVRAALAPLYAALSTDQKAKLDHASCPHME